MVEIIDEPMKESKWKMIPTEGTPVVLADFPGASPALIALVTQAAAAANSDSLYSGYLF